MAMPLQGSFLGSQPSTRTLSTLPRAPRIHATKVVAGLRSKGDPWSTLGLQPGAAETDIKRAHRQLVKKHHPDVKSGDVFAHAQFLSIQEAYEILMGKRRGKEIETSSSSGWDFHDWYWKFSMKHRKRNQSAAGDANSPPSPPPAEALRYQWKQQLSGLKQRAAAKSAQGPSNVRYTNGQKKEARAAAANSAAWKSTTKNARTSQATTSSARNTRQEASTTLQAESAATTARAQQAAPPTSPPLEPSTPAMKKQQQDPVLSHISTSTASDLDSVNDISDVDFGAAATAAAAEERAQQDLREKWADALNAVHHLHTRHRTQMKETVNQIVNFTRKLKIPLHPILQQQRSEEFAHSGGMAPPSATTFMHHHQHHEGEQNKLHVEFDANVHARRYVIHSSTTMNPSNAHHQHHHNSSSDAAAGLSSFKAPTAANNEDLQTPHSSSYSKSNDDDNVRSHHTDQHARKFADREHVESRLGHQLAGLKRRAALKKEL